MAHLKIVAHSILQPFLRWIPDILYFALQVQSGVAVELLLTGPEIVGLLYFFRAFVRSHQGTQT
jgi:hypothetical protein